MAKSKTNNRGRFADPVEFAEKLLGLKLWPLQREILRTVATARRTAVKSCHSSGKTFTAAIVALWWAARYRDGRVIITAPGFTQVKSVVWSQLHQFIRAAKFKFPAVANQTELRFAPGNEIIGISTNEGTRFQGFHSGHLLIIADEAVGIEADIWEAIEGTLASGTAHILMLGNPTVASGAFHAAFTRERVAWKTFTISAFDTPNFKDIPDINALLELPDESLDMNLAPYLITRRWARERWDAWWNGTIETSPLWASRILGEFPAESENALIGLNHIEHARRPANDTGGRVDIGIDVAGPGKDESVLTAVCDGAVLEQRTWRMPDPRGVIAEALSKWRPRLGAVRVDSAGIGYHVATHITDLGYNVEMTNVGSGTLNPERFLNLRAELSWGMRERFREGVISGIVDAELAAQLSSLRYQLTSKGTIQIESKDDMRRRGVHSPDRADALMLALGVHLGSEAGVQHFRRLIAGMEEAYSRPAAPNSSETSYGKQIGNLWPKITASPSPWGRMTCRHCKQPIGGEVYTVTGGLYGHSVCEQRFMTGG